MISARDVWRIFLIFLTFAVLMLAAGVAIQRDILPSSVERDVHEHPAFVKHDGSGGYMRKGATVQLTGTGTRARGTNFRERRKDEVRRINLPRLSGKSK
jgi:hypothetical protein